MRANRLLLGAAVIGMAGLSACGTITQGGSQTLDVVVKGSPSAWCEFTTQHFRNVGTFPNKLNLERSKDPLTAECKGEQNLYKKFVIQPRPIDKVVAADTVTGVVPLGYDFGTGGMWEYPDPLIVDFRNTDEGEGPKPTWPGDVTAPAAAQIERPTPMRMQPVMDEQLNPSEPGQSGSTEVIDAVRLAVDGTPVAVTKTSTTVPAASKSTAARMKPIISPEDDPAVMKAKQEAKAKAAAKAAEAKRKAAEDKAAEAAAAKAAEEAKEAEAAAAKAAEEAKEASDAAAAAEAAAAPASAAAPAETPPSDAALTPPSSEAAPATAPGSAPEAAPPATSAPETASQRSSEMPPPAEAPASSGDAAPAEKKSEMPPAAEPAPSASGQSTDMDKYLSGGK